MPIVYGDVRPSWIERLIDWFLGRQHDRDLRWSLGEVPRYRRGEALRETWRTR